MNLLQATAAEAVEQFDLFLFDAYLLAPSVEVLGGTVTLTANSAIHKELQIPPQHPAKPVITGVFQNGAFIPFDVGQGLKK